MPRLEHPGRVLVAAVLLMLVLAAPARAAWTAAVELSDDASRDAEALQVGANETGDAVAAWNSGTNVVAALIPVGGVPALTPYEGIYGEPTVDVGGQGVAAVAFHSLSVPASRAILGGSRPTGATAFGAVGPIEEGPTTDNSIKAPVLAVNDLGGALVFHDRGIRNCDACTHQMGAQLLTDPATNAWTAPSSVSSYQSETYNRVIATAVDGTAVALFKTNNGQQFRSIEPVFIGADGSASKGASIEGTSGNLSGALTNPSGIAVARMPNGDVVAALERKPGTGGGVFVLDFPATRAAAGGTGAPPEVQVSEDTDGSAPELATDPPATPSSPGTTRRTASGTPRPCAPATGPQAGLRPVGRWRPVPWTATTSRSMRSATPTRCSSTTPPTACAPEQPARRAQRASGERRPRSAPASAGVADPRVAGAADNAAFAAFTADNGTPANRAVYMTKADVTPIAPPRRLHAGALALPGPVGHPEPEPESAGFGAFGRVVAATANAQRAATKAPRRQAEAARGKALRKAKRVAKRAPSLKATKRLRKAKRAAARRRSAPSGPRAPMSARSRPARLPAQRRYLRRWRARSASPASQPSAHTPDRTATQRRRRGSSGTRWEPAGALAARPEQVGQQQGEDRDQQDQADRANGVGVGGEVPDREGDGAEGHEGGEDAEDAHAMQPKVLRQTT